MDTLNVTIYTDEELEAMDVPTLKEKMLILTAQITPQVGNQCALIQKWINKKIFDAGYHFDNTIPGHNTPGW